MKLMSNVEQGFQESPERSALGLRILGGLVLAAAVAEYFVFGSQSAGEMVADGIFAADGLGLIGASYLLERNSN